jgi:alanine racemase
MTFSLTVDAPKFRSHLNDVLTKCKSVDVQLVPVIKGNGYGFTREILAKEATGLGLKRIAVGTVWELSEALAKFSGEIVVLEPFNSADSLAVEQWRTLLKNNSARVILTLSNLDFVGAREVGASLIYLEGITSLHRFGISKSELFGIDKSNLGTLSVLGMSLHLPIADSQKMTGATTEVSSAVDNNKLSGKLSEIWDWIGKYQEVAAKQSFPMHFSLSHVSVAEVETIRAMCAGYNFQVSFDLRLGTSLWLGTPSALSVSGTVLEIHELANVPQVGYQQVATSGHNRLIVVSGGTSHGVALAAPTTKTSFRKRGIAVAEGFAQALGKVRSPFSVRGHNLVFAEPPHMHVCLLWANDSSIKVGDKLVCNVRNTTTVFDQVIGLD